MKKGILSILLVVMCCGVFTQCEKQHNNTPMPFMNARINLSDTFVANTVITSTLTSQLGDSAPTLILTGYKALNTDPYIVLGVKRYKGHTGTFSIVEGQAYATYRHPPSTGYSIGGIVSITKVTSGTISGYFSFITSDSNVVSSGNFLAVPPSTY
jgi:hypothetical protein